MKYFEDIKKFVENKMVFCGIDIHKKIWVLCFYCNGEYVEKISISGNFHRLLDHITRFYSTARDIHFVYEAGFSGFHLYRKLMGRGYQCTITPPNRVPSYRDKVKTDKRDAAKLVQYLASGMLKKVFVPPLTVESDRQLIRLRAATTKKITRVKNQIKSHLHLYGIAYPKENGNKWSKRHLAWLETLEFEEENLRYILDQYLGEYHFLRAQLAKLTNRIRHLSKSDAYQGHFNRLVSCRGVGLITGMGYLLELYDLLRFPSSSQFCSYLGLTPSQYSTGEHIRFGHITREGNSRVRSVLVESAWTVIRHDPFLRDKYNRIRAKGGNGKKAIVAVARSLAVRLRRCLLDDVPYAIDVC